MALKKLQVHLLEPGTEPIIQWHCERDHPGAASPWVILMGTADIFLLWDERPPHIGSDSLNSFSVALILGVKRF